MNDGLDAPAIFLSKQHQDLPELHGEEGAEAAHPLGGGPLRGPVHRCVRMGRLIHAAAASRDTSRINLNTTQSPHPTTAVKGSDCVVFLDWEDGALIRRIDVAPRHVYWNETGELVLLACDESYFGACLCDAIP